MTTHKIFDLITLEAPDDFHRMSKEEIAETFPEETTEVEVLFDKNTNTRIMMYRKKFNPVLLALADKKSMRAKVASDFKAANPSFEATESYAYLVDGKKGLGIRYTMNVNDEDRYGDTLILTKGGNYLVFSCSSPEAHQEFAATSFDDILLSAKF